MASTQLITHVTYTLHTESLKLRTLTCELLAAICLLSVTQGYRLVLAAFSDYCIAHEEAFRFEELIGSLRLSSTSEDIDGEEMEEEGEGGGARRAHLLVKLFIIRRPSRLFFFLSHRDPNAPV